MYYEVHLSIINPSELNVITREKYINRSEFNSGATLRDYNSSSCTWTLCYLCINEIVHMSFLMSAPSSQINIRFFKNSHVFIIALHDIFLVVFFLCQLSTWGEFYPIFCASTNDAFLWNVKCRKMDTASKVTLYQVLFKGSWPWMSEFDTYDIITYIM